MEIKTKEGNINHQHELDIRKDIHQRELVIIFAMEMRRFNFERQESQRIQEEQMRMTNNNFEEQLRNFHD